MEDKRINELLEWVIEERYYLTRGIRHVTSMMEICIILCKRLNIPEDDVTKCLMGVIVHDIGRKSNDEDHIEEGKRILERRKKDVIEKAQIDEEQFNLLYEMINNHRHYQDSYNDLSDNEKTLVDIVRVSDKISKFFKLKSKEKIQEHIERINNKDVKENAMYILDKLFELEE